jgi:cytoskeleton protein RodZ
MDSMNPPVAAPSRPGPMLQKARQDLHLAPEDVAQLLHLSVRQVVALEQDDYKNLPGPTYVRGYLRSYAQLLGLVPEKIIESYNAAIAAVKSPAPSRPAAPRQVSSGDRLVKIGTVTIAAVVLGLAYAWWRNPAETPPVLSRTQAPVAAVPAAAPAATAAPAGEAAAAQLRAASVPAPAQPSRPAAAAVPAPELLPGGDAGATHRPAAAAPVMISGMILNVAPAEPAKPASAAAPHLDRALARQPTDVPPDAPRAHLVLYAEQECWADVRDAGDNKLLYENIPAGRRVTIEGAAPLRVFLGNADGVRVEYNGKHFDISRYKRGQVARFTLGENTAVNH